MQGAAGQALNIDYRMLRAHTMIWILPLSSFVLSLYIPHDTWAALGLPINSRSAYPLMPGSPKNVPSRRPLMAAWAAINGMKCDRSPPTRVPGRVPGRVRVRVRVRVRACSCEDNEGNAKSGVRDHGLDNGDDNNGKQSKRAGGGVSKTLTP